MPHSSRWLWAGIISLGVVAVLRQYLFAHSYWYDEAFLVLAVRARGYADLLGAQPYNLMSTPLFLWAARLLYDLGGAGELVLRLPALVAGLLSLLVMVPLARRIVGGPAALLAVAWLAFSRHLVLHSCDLRPYTLDLLVAELVLWSTVLLLRRPHHLAAVGLGVLALVAPWASFPSVFCLGGAALALLCVIRTRAGFLWWGAFNLTVLLSGLAHWWFSARHLLAYPGMTDHWGPHGWGGFPGTNLFAWLVTRPYEVANYGTRDLGSVVALLALVGGIALARRKPALLVLLIGPFALTLVAALLGKYPLAHRTGFFLLPSVWLLAACGIAALPRRPAVALACCLLVAWDGAHLLRGLVQPDGRYDFRGAYALIHERQQPDDAIWSPASDVVYEVYHGQGGAFDAALDEVRTRVTQQRLWAVLGESRDDLRRHLEAAGGHVIEEHRVSGLMVLLFEPAYW